MKPDEPQITYVRPEWKIWPSFMVLLAVVLAGLVLGVFENSVQRPAGFLLLANVIQFACFFLIPIYVAGVLHKQPLSSLGLQAQPLSYGLGKGLVWGVGLYALNMLASTLQLFVFPNQPQDLQPVMEAMLGEANGLELGGLIFCVTVLAPVGEEIFFRSFLFGALEARFGKLAGIIVSAAIFASVHGSVWHLLPMFVGGCGFALLYARYRDISLNIIAHATWNSIAVILMFSMFGG